MRVENYQKVIIVWLGISPVFQNPLEIGKNGKTKWVLKDWGDAQSHNYHFSIGFYSHIYYFIAVKLLLTFGLQKHVLRFFYVIFGGDFRPFPDICRTREVDFRDLRPKLHPYGSFHFWPNVPFKLWNLSRRQCCRMQIRGSMYVGMHRLKNKP